MPRLLFPIARTGCVLITFVACVVASARSIDLEDLFRFHRVSDPQVSPDGKTVVYVVSDVDKAENRTVSMLWLVALDDGKPRRLLTGSNRQERHPRWSPDGRWILFDSNRDGDFQVWIAPARGGEPRRLTVLSTGATGAIWSPDGKQIAFLSAVLPEYSEKPYKESNRLNQEQREARERSKVKARVLTGLLYRHWDAWTDGKRQHLYVLPVNNGSSAGDPRDVTPGDRDAAPTASTFTSGDEFTFSPDGKRLTYVAGPPVREEAWSTNYDLLSVDLQNGERRTLTPNPAADTLPRYSPDGRFLAYRAQARPGFESDRWQLMLVDLATGERRSLTTDFDASVRFFLWAPDSARIFFEAIDQGEEPLWSVDLTGGRPQRLPIDGVNTSPSLAFDGKTLVFCHELITRPTEVVKMDVSSAASTAVTHTNDALLAPLEMSPPESVTVSGAGGTPVQMWIVRPPRFDPTKKYPLVFWVHGGPQSAFQNAWSTRWNPEVWAAQGYVVVLPNPRGSVGFGQKFVDEISRDWGGKVYDDLMACVSYLELLPWIDRTRMAAAGASFGGYMINWFQGHTDKFCALITHDGVYNFSSNYGETEELWFDEWEHGIPWDREDFERFSPHRYVANFKTPHLVIHGELDYRVNVSEGLQLFTALQRKGIPSKLLYFPDEGHWVMKPQNSELWHKTIFAWLAEYLK